MALPKIFFQSNLNMKFWSGVICVCSFLIVVTHCQTSQPDCYLTECNQCLNLQNSSKIFVQCSNKTCHCVDTTANLSHVCGDNETTSESSTPDAFSSANSSQLCEVLFPLNSSLSNITEAATTNSSNGTVSSTTATLNVSTSPETPTTIGPTTPASSTSTSAPSTAAATTNATTEVTNVTTEATIIPALVNVTTDSTLKPTEETGKPESSSTLKPAFIAEGRHFDGASFIGGMILAVGLIAISYVGLKFYRSRTENNYHTLREAIHM